MTYSYQKPFQPELLSTNSSFNSFDTGGGADGSSANALESTGVREWVEGPSGRALRLCESSGVDYRIQLGTSTVTASTTSTLMLGGTVESIRVLPGQTHIAIRSASTSTGAVVNVTIGRGQ